MIRRHADLTRGMVGAWSASGSGASSLLVPDSSPYRRHATFTGTLVASGSGMAAAVTGGTSLSMPSSASIIAGDCALSLWVYLTSYNGGFCALVDKGGAGQTREFSIFFNTAGNVSYAVIGTAVSGTARALGLTLNAWQHIAIVRTAGVVTYYRNGVSTSTDSGLAGTTATAFAWSFGANPSTGGSNPNAYYDDIRLYTRSLAAAEVRALAARRGIGITPERTRRAAILAQFWIRISGAWKTAQPWLNVGGTWKRTTPKLKAGNVWKG